ncbi:MAG TPA: TIR domain-containing protein [Thermoanaerobaculia bacterium]|nr:TIR domain-containing protein [Thermoanaerobaculia bacterium]
MADGIRIFVSWSGARAQRVAEELREWLPLIFDGAQLWLSSSDLSSGRRWSHDLAAALEQSNFGVVVLTPESSNSPWSLFEAGALSKRVAESAVVPYLVGMIENEIPEPLSQFQATSADRTGTLRLVLAIAQQLEAVQKTVVRRFEGFWPELEAKLADILKTQPAHPQIRNDDRMEIIQLRSELADLTGLVKSIAAQIVARPDVLPRAEDTDFRELEGAWMSSHGSHIYLKIIGTKLFGAFCHANNDQLDAIYYDWRQVGDDWFARFGWIRKHAFGFAFYRVEHGVRIVGRWWLSDDELEPGAPVDQPPGGAITIWTRVTDLATPAWAEEFFNKTKIESQPRTA